MQDLRLAMVSMNSRVGDVSGNLAKMVSYCERASDIGADILCFPELSLTGYAMPDSSGYPIDEDSQEFRTIEHISFETGMCICFGYVGEGPTICQALVEGGEVVGVYSKTHLGDREEACMVPGQSLDVFITSRAKIAIQLCWEAHFPEITCTYAMKGADIVLMPFGSGLGGERRRSSWNRILPARAYDNTVYVGACNAFGPTGSGTVLGGGVSIYDCRGIVMSEDYSGEGMVYADLTSEPLDRIRAEGYENMRDLYFLDKRRPEIYFRSRV